MKTSKVYVCETCGAKFDDKSKCSAHEKDCKLINDIIINKMGYRLVKSCHSCKYLICDIGYNLGCEHMENVYKNRNNTNELITFNTNKYEQAYRTVCNYYEPASVDTYARMVGEMHVINSDDSNTAIKLPPIDIKREE